MPKETIKTRDEEITVGWNAYTVQLSIDLNSPFEFASSPGNQFTALYATLSIDDITQLQKNLARAKRYLKNH